MDRAADTVPLTTKGFPPVPIDATKPPISMRHLPAIKISGGVQLFINRPPIVFVAPIGVELSTISLISIASPTVDITGPTKGIRLAKGSNALITFTLL